jgi:hypothetical protein
MTNYPTFIVVPQAAGLAGNTITFNASPSWAIVNTRTREVVEGGFSCRDEAEDYMWQEYLND